MLKSRNDMTHIYDKKAAEDLVKIILKEYIPCFQKMKENVLKQYGTVLDSL